MGILFSEIYEKSIGLFDDPKITTAYEHDVIQFQKLMYSYLQNAIGLFTNPAEIGYSLSHYQKPSGQMEVFVGDGINDSFFLDESFKVLEDSIYSFKINGIATSGHFDKERSTVTFPVILPCGQEYSFEQYHAGCFLEEIGKKCPDPLMKNNVNEQVKNILARLLVKAWAENQRNFLLDIQNLLTDTDFKIFSNANSTNAKNSWFKQLDFEMGVMQNKLAWMLKFAPQKHHRGNHYGR